MTIATDTQTDTARYQQAEGKASDNVPHLLPVIGQGGDELQAQSRIADLATHITQLVMQRLPVTAASPLCWSEQTNERESFAEQVSVTLTACKQQGFRYLLLVPWGKLSLDSLLEPAHFTLSTMSGEAVSLTEMALPHVHVEGVSARGALEGLSSIQTQLRPLLEAFPCWDRSWIRLSTSEMKVVLLRSGGWTTPPSQTAVWEMPTMKALTAALSPQQAGFMTASERWRWQRDGQIYVHYLVSLLCAATEFLQRE